jgi:hypothetical protein
MVVIRCDRRRRTSPRVRGRDEAVGVRDSFSACAAVAVREVWAHITRIMCRY